MPAQRDPVSQLLDRGAAELLLRAYSAGNGEWVMTRLADPTPDHVSWARGELGIELMGPDRPTTASGRNKTAHTRWGRAFVRALYYQHLWYGDPSRKRMRGMPRSVKLDRPLEVDWGRRMPALGIIPAGRAVRVRIVHDGRQSRRAVQAMPVRDRIFAIDGKPAARWSDIAKRDWA